MPLLLPPPLSMYGTFLRLALISNVTLSLSLSGSFSTFQVECTVCNNVSDQYENMMDLTVEIHGDAVSLEECLDQFTATEWLQGDNMYKCDRYY